MNRKVLHLPLLGVLLLVWLCPTSLHAENLDSVLCILDATIERRAYYEQTFLRDVDSLRQKAERQTHPAEKLRLIISVAEMEFRHSSKAALEAYREAEQLARKQGNVEAAERCRMKTAIIYGQINLPWEGQKILRDIGEPSRFSPETRRIYYDAFNDLYDFYRQGDIRGEISEAHLAEATLFEDSVRKYLHTPSQQAINFTYSSPNIQEMISTLRREFNRLPQDGSRALVAIVLANKYHLLRDNAARDYWWAVSAIYSLRYVRYEYEALLRLSRRMYDMGDINRGAHYALAAYEMADIWGSPARKIELSQTLSRGLAIDHEAVHHLRDTMGAWRIVALVTLFLLLLLLFLFLRHRKRAGTALSVLRESRCTADTRIETLRSEVADKSEYIVRSLSLSLDSLFYIEQMRMTVLARIKSGDTDRLRRQLSAGELSDKFREECLKRFDLSFFHLYPDFVRRVNRLFRPEAQILLSDTEILNNELRVLAFAKMGINDAARIATILGVSVHTVYWYRNHIKNRAVDRAAFDEAFAAL